MNKQKAIQNLDEIITKVEGARLYVSHHHIVHIIAISKYSSVTDINTLYNAGQRAFGENKVQDLKLKNQELEDLPLQWHFVGRLQSNKINNLIDLNLSLMHSLDSFDLAIQLNKKLSAKKKTMKCLLQINSANEQSKAGVSSSEAISVYEQISTTCPNIKLVGVMSIGANTSDKKLVKESFKITKKIFDKLQDSGAIYCSMGMSSDFELAIKCGSNMIRVGSSLFKD